MTTPQSKNDLSQMIREAARVVVFTGAGISTESGIPDFRSPGGLWTKMKPIDFQDFVADAAVRRESWRRKFEGQGTIADAKPNRGHMAVAKLVETGKASHVITQNIDNLHQNSGVPVDQVIELHGNSTYATCLDCGAPYELADLEIQFTANGDVPDCEHCGGIIKTATISFGQSMPQLQMIQAEEATLACDLFLAIGSSLQVFPAAGFPIIAKRNGARLVILNRDPTDLDGYADLVINDEIGPVLSAAVGLD